MSFENPLASFFPEKKREQLSPEEVMRCIEDLPVDDGVREGVALVLKGLKRCVGEVNVSLTEGDEGEVQVSQEEAARRLSDFENTLEKLGLFAVAGRRVVLDDGNAFQQYIIGASLEEVTELDQIWEEASSESIPLEKQKILERRKGELLGFPKTAVEAFAESIGEEKELSPKTRVRLSKLQIGTEELPGEIQAEDYMAFQGFILSRGHWREELETVKRWAQAVKEVDPFLYQRILKESAVREILKEVK